MDIKSELLKSMEQTLGSNNEETVSKEEQATPDKKSGKAAEGTTPQHYTAEELRELAKLADETTFDKVDKERLEEEMKEKYKLLQSMATKRQQFIAEKEKKLDELLQQIQSDLKVVEEQKTRLQEGFEDDEDPKWREVKERMDKTENALNWNKAMVEIKTIIPEFGMFTEEEMAETVKKHPALAELANEKNARYATLVLGAAHYLTLADNMDKYVEHWLTNNYEKHEKLLVSLAKKLSEKYKKAQDITMKTKMPATSQSEEEETKGKDLKEILTKEFKKQFDKITK